MRKPEDIKILIGFEESQSVCKSFRALGFEAYSNDLQVCSGGCPGWHLNCDFFDALKSEKWDLIVLHPPCTYTALCGNRWYSGTQDRLNGILLCSEAWEESIKIAPTILEQPKTIMQRFIGPKSQVIHPWQFGHGETKETWLWLHNLPKLQPTDIVDGRENRIWKMPPSKDRAKLRSKTYHGIAEAIANQYGTYLIQTL